MDNNGNDKVARERLRSRKRRDKKKEADSRLALEHQQLVLEHQQLVLVNQGLVSENQGLVSENEQLREVIQRQQATIDELQPQLLHSDNMAPTPLKTGRTTPVKKAWTAKSRTPAQRRHGLPPRGAANSPAGSVSSRAHSHGTHPLSSILFCSVPGIQYYRN
jgi:hypothetical protein